MAILYGDLVDEPVKSKAKSSLSASLPLRFSALLSDSLHLSATLRLSASRRFSPFLSTFRLLSPSPPLSSGYLVSICERHDRGSEADKIVDHTDVVADEENSSVKVAGKGKRKFLDEGAETRKKKVLCKRSAEKFLTFGPETMSFIEGLIRTSVTSLGDVLSMQMANMERVFTERMGKMEIEVSQLKDAISLTGEGSYPSKKETEEAPLNSKAKEAPPKSKGAQAPPKSKGAQAQPKRKGDQPTPTKKFLTHMNTSRRHSYGVPSRCWCGKGVVIFYSRTDDNPYRRFYRCEIGAQRKKENHLFKWVDDALLDEIRRVEAEQGRIVEEIEDLKSSITQRIEEEVRKQKNSLELGCLGSILWLFGRLRSQE
ncbi:hypothetical protein HID58_065978 [Brassica napus]|uniref:GRF-type domain-containing protein n=1 Tax=Brassica napus TaxID=3708 RepID=A0ABQ7ZED1_BRANA|nr:hypothetical protein HID58_065978 [Brassica napus]